MKRILPPSALVFALVLSSCQKPPMPPSAFWTGSLSAADGKQIHMKFSLNQKTTPPTSCFMVGDERTKIPEVMIRNDSLSFIFSEYSAAMRAVWDGKELRGAYFRYRKDTVSIPFVAAPETEQAPSTAKQPLNYVPLVGKFQAYLKDGDRIDSSTTASFAMKNDSIFGTFIAPDGDYGLLAGTQHGSHVELHRFTGWQAFRVELDQHEGRWNGKLYARNLPPSTFSLVPEAMHPSAAAEAKTPTPRDPKKPFSFVGINTNGDTVRSTDARFKGKALLIDFMGTWCHNCMDAAPLLQKLYSEYQAKGLEIVGLSFEIKNDPELGKKNLSLYAERYGITFPLLFMGSLDEQNVAKKIKSQLNDFSAWPTALLIDRHGRIRSIHVGFHGPGTGEEYQAQVQEYYHLVQELLNIR